MNLIKYVTEYNIIFKMIKYVIFYFQIDLEQIWLAKDGCKSRNGLNYNITMMF